MVTIGVDPHKQTHIAAAVDELGSEVAHRTVPARPAGNGQLLECARALDCERVWAVENVPNVSGSLDRPSPMQIGLIYCSTDGHESISLSQFPAGGSNPYREPGDGEGRETVTRGGIEMTTRPSRWGQAQVELERDGTLVRPHVRQPHARPGPDDRGRPAIGPQHQQHLTIRANRSPRLVQPMPTPAVAPIRQPA
jgi:hypothetical protein